MCSSRPSCTSSARAIARAPFIGPVHPGQVVEDCQGVGVVAVEVRSDGLPGLLQQGEGLGICRSTWYA